MSIKNIKNRVVVYVFLSAPFCWCIAHGSIPARETLVLSVDRGNRQGTVHQTREARIPISDEEVLEHQVATSVVGYIRSMRMYEGHRELLPINLVENGQPVVIERMFQYMHDKEHDLQYTKSINELILLHYKDDSWDIFRKLETTPSIDRNLKGEELARIESSTSHMMYRVYGDDRVRSLSLTSATHVVDREDGKEYTHRFSPNFWMESLEAKFARAAGQVDRDTRYDEDGRLLYMKLDNRRGVIKEVLVEDWSNDCNCPGYFMVINWRAGAPYESFTFTRDDSIAHEFLGDEAHE